MRKRNRLLWVGLALAVVGCSENLEVQNQNNPDAVRALARPGDVENLISASFSTSWNATYGSGHWAQLICYGLENYSNLANFGMGSRSQLPRPPVDNSRNANATSDNYNAYLGMHRAARAASLGLSRVAQPTFTFFPASATQKNRAIAFANFVIGISLGQVSLAYDSGAAVSDTDAAVRVSPLPLLDYNTLNAYALSRLDSALAYSSTSTTTGWGTGATAQVLPITWMSSTNTVTSTQFQAIVRGWKARLRANVARDPAERAAVDWSAVIADADAFLAVFPGGTPATEFVMTRIASGSPFGFGNLITLYQSNSVNWHQVWGYVAGMAADQASYDAWLATSPALRVNYTVVTPDRRFPQGATRAAQQAAPGLYVENKATGVDWFGDPTGNSQYRHTRWLALRNGIAAGQSVTFLMMPAAMLRLLAAEGEYRAGNFVGAAARVNVSRVGVAVLPAAPADATTLVPGGANCVPRLPVGPGFTSSACGNLWEALKWEKRMETQLTVYGAWYFDGRGWGDLPQGSGPHWPVPYNEMDTRSQPFYVIPGSAAVGTYGI